MVMRCIYMALHGRLAGQDTPCCVGDAVADIKSLVLCLDGYHLMLPSFPQRHECDSEKTCHCRKPAVLAWKPSSTIRATVSGMRMSLRNCCCCSISRARIVGPGYLECSFSEKFINVWRHTYDRYLMYLGSPKYCR